jgi:hypothetical protein
MEWHHHVGCQEHAMRGRWPCIAQILDEVWTPRHFLDATEWLFCAGAPSIEVYEKVCEATKPTLVEQFVAFEKLIKTLHRTKFDAAHIRTLILSMCGRCPALRAHVMARVICLRNKIPVNIHYKLLGELAQHGIPWSKPSNIDYNYQQFGYFVVASCPESYYARIKGQYSILNLVKMFATRRSKISLPVEVLVKLKALIGV